MFSPKPLSNDGIWTTGNNFQWNLKKNTIFIEEHLFENGICKKAILLSRSKCVKFYRESTWFCSRHKHIEKYQRTLHKRNPCDINVYSCFLTASFQNQWCYAMSWFALDKWVLFCFKVQVSILEKLSDSVANIKNRFDIFF